MSVWQWEEIQALPRSNSIKMRALAFFRVFWNIMLPLSTPAVITLLLVNALFVWIELLIAGSLNGEVE